MGKKNDVAVRRLDKEREHRAYLKVLLIFLHEQLEKTHTHGEWAREMVGSGHFETVAKIIEDAEEDLPAMLFLMKVSLGRAHNRAHRKGGVK